jgi:hypothetical protein
MEERRGVNLGCVVAGLGLALSCCLLPYLVSSIYSIVGALVNGSQTPTWLWGELANRLAPKSNLLYILLTDAPICCVGTVGLLVIILGVVLLLGGTGEQTGASEQDLEVSPDEPNVD